jgi:hypothetical protein
MAASREGNRCGDGSGGAASALPVAKRAKTKALIADRRGFMTGESFWKGGLSTTDG